MTKANKNNKNKKRAVPKARNGPAPVTTRQGPMQIRQIPRHIVSAVCGLVDPFCDHAYGAKYPDSSSARTLAYGFHGLVELATDASGNGALLFLPQYAHYAWVAGTGTYPNYSFATMAFNPPFPSVSAYRIVSAGVKIRSIAAPLTASGVVRIRTFGCEDGLALSGINVTSYAVSNSLDIPLRECSNAVVVCSRSSAPPAMFYNVDEDQPTTVGWKQRGVLPFAIALNGGPASAQPIEVEYFIHYELIFDDGTGMALLATPAPTASAVVVESAAALTSTIPKIVKEGALQLGKMVVTNAVKAVGTYLFGPAGGAVASRGFQGALAVD